jgi:hypothetical protein
MRVDCTEPIIWISVQAVQRDQGFIARHGDWRIARAGPSLAASDADGIYGAASGWRKTCAAARREEKSKYLMLPYKKRQAAGDQRMVFEMRGPEPRELACDVHDGYHYYKWNGSQKRSELMTDSQPQYPVLLTKAQRKIVAELAPELADRLKLDEHGGRTIRFTPAELLTMKRRAGRAVQSATSGVKLNSLSLIELLTREALDRSRGLGAIPAAERVYQFRITLLEANPLIWRRIQVKNCTLDKLHEHVQLAMGWTNSHLHHFRIGMHLYGDPMLMQENFADLNYGDSTSTKISEILPRTGRRFRFGYKYDFGDDWQHDIVFEGCLRAERGKRYPVCVEGARACPPEDVGGVWGYAECLEALANPNHERHEEFSEWIGGSFNPEDFDPATATKMMRRGLPNWREWV